ncbi:MAG: hypothetical protein JOZ69_20260, partial [Myxococcales bacterium]|nr:hypothetical protein [Myxococcales bacterium]
MPLDLNVRTMIGVRALTRVPRAFLAVLVLTALVVTPMLPPFRATRPAVPSAGPPAEAAPVAVSAHELVPADVEPGDRIAVLGEGFPADRRARVVFRGTLFRPGERPARGVEIALPAVRMTPERVEVALDEEAERLFCGA